MDPKNRMLLLHHQQDLIRDLDVTYILDELFTKKAISNDDFDNIFQQTSRVDRTRCLIDAIQNGNNSAYEAFVDSLSKDHRWLWEKFSVENNEQMNNDSFEDSLSRGDVPRLPDHFVHRSVVDKNVSEKLKLLTRHNFLVLHGMSGSGKTTVAVSALRDNPDLITNDFNGVVFWLNLGTVKTEDDIVAYQNKLYRKASSIYTRNSFMNSSVSMTSIGSNADTQSLSSYDWTWLELRDRLKQQFAEATIKEALLVLDEVNEKKCVDAFDIGCKTLITTRDTEVVANFHAQIIKVENSFTEQETLKLFASCLDVAVNQLPRQAKKLHDICKGSPFHIALIGAQLAENKERMNDDTSAWNYYLSRMEKKELFEFLSRNNHNPMKAIEVCINSLRPNILSLFKMLTVLPDNVKVSPKVLSKLWNKEINEVESIMKQLRSKSLIQEIYDHDQRNYIYEIHDLIMNYLRTCSSEDEVKKLHAEFLKSYHYDSVDGAPTDIENDGYIAYYIGYHILKTHNLNNKWRLFNKLYLDLKFLGNKVRLTGPADVILDLQKYESYIADDDFNLELLYNIKGYLSTHGIDLYRYPCTDIVQSILQHETKGKLFTKALQVAQEKCAKNELYFEFLHEQNVEEIKPSDIDVKEIITSVCFLGDYALVGTMSGIIKFFHISTNKLKKELCGTGFAVKWVGVCPVDPRLVAALSYDGVIRLHHIDDVDQDGSDVIEEEPDESNYKNYLSNVTIPPKRGTCINCRWAEHEEILVTHTAKLIILYDPSGEVLNVIDIMESGREIMCCIPCNNDKNAVIATSGSTHYLEVIDLTTKEKVISYQESDVLIDILSVPGSTRIVTLKNNEVLDYDFKNKCGYNWNVCRCTKIITSEAVKKDLTFLSIAINKSGTLLFVSTDDSRVICVDLKTNSRVFDLENRRGNIVSMAVSEVCLIDFLPGSDVLLTGTGTVENSAKVWYLDATYVSQTTRNGKTRLSTKFDVSFVQSVTPQTPNTPKTSSGSQSSSSTPKRHQSFYNHKEDANHKVLKGTMSLDRHSLKPLVLKGICNGNGDECSQPLLVVVDDRNNIQIMRGRKILSEIPAKTDVQITAVKISPCNQYILYGLKNGNVIKYTLRTKESKAIMDVSSPVQYLSFVNSNILMCAGRDRCLMAYRLTSDGQWKPMMMQRGNAYLGSQEILNDIQGKRKISTSDLLSNSDDSETSLSSKDRLFPNGNDPKNLSKCSGLVDCFWVPDVGLITVESNATVKLWDQSLVLVSVLNGRREVCIACTTFRKNILVICDDNTGFQTLELKLGSQTELHQIQEYRLNSRVLACDLTADGLVLAMGLWNGDVVVWNVPGKRQLRLLKHHKTKVQYCSFSPVPDRLFRSTALNTGLHSPSPGANPPSYVEGDDDLPPLVLVTMASEIVWWNVTYLIKMRANKAYWRIGMNVITPNMTPRTDNKELAAQMENLNIESPPPNNFFFGDGPLNSHECWKAIWKKKTYKEDSKRKEILACIKLSGMSAKKLCHDDKFSCFVTVDNPGHIHIMNVMKPANT